MPTQDPTTNYGWNLPDVDGDVDAWGDILNAILGDDTTGIDARLKAVSNVADAALPKAGGVMTGELQVQTDSHTAEAVASTSGDLDLDLAVAQFFSFTVTENTAITFSNVPATGRFIAIILEITNGGAFAVTWPGSVAWPSGVAPELTESGVDLIVAYTIDGGTTWRASRGMEDSQ